MPKRMLMVVTAAVVFSGGLMTAQTRRTETAPTAGTAKGARVDLGRPGAGPTYAYNVSFQINGVVVRADRAVINQREVTLEGNVRMTLPAPK